jgi:hypothetical protein
VRLHISFAVPEGTPPNWIGALLAGQDIEADAYIIDPKLGTLTIGNFIKDAAGVAVGREDIVVYAPGAWRSIADVGALAAAVVKEAPSEDPRRRQEARQARTA